MRNLIAMIWICALLAVTGGIARAVTDANNGDWTQQQVTLSNTPEAALMVRVGDINNLGFGWPAGFDPFSGNSTPVHSYPWTPPSTALPGLDRIMVPSSYNGNPPYGQDGYTSSTSRPDNAVQDITMSYDLGGIAVQSAVLQMFVDDFQAPVWHANYQATINGKRAPFIDSVINSLSQTGPVGSLITLKFTPDLLPEIATGKLVLRIDDTTTGAGDGYAIDFVKLLVNPVALTNTGTVSGQVSDAAGNPLANVVVSANSGAGVKTDSSGNFTLTGVTAGLASITASLSGFQTGRVNVDVIAGKSQSVSISLAQGTVTGGAYALAVTTSGAGSGTVVSADGNIDCGSICNAYYDSGIGVTLTASPAGDSTFIGWGGACAGAGTCRVTMDAAKDVTGTFGKIPFIATTTGVTAGLITAPVATVTTRVTFNAVDVGKRQSVFVTAWAPLNTLSPAQRARIAEYTLLRVYAQTTTTSFALVQLTSSGWQPVVNGQLIPYVSGVLGDQSAAISILDNTDTSKLLGSQFCVGYGTSATEMTAARRMQLLATIPNQSAAKSSSGSCNVALPISDARVFAYAEANYASLFAGAVRSGQYQQYDYRYYADTRNYLAVDTSGTIFILGPVSNDVVTGVAPVESFRDVITTWEGAP